MPVVPLLMITPALLYVKDDFLHFLGYEGTKYLKYKHLPDEFQLTEAKTGKVVLSKDQIEQRLEYMSAICKNVSGRSIKVILCEKNMGTHDASASSTLRSDYIFIDPYSVLHYQSPDTQAVLYHEVAHIIYHHSKIKACIFVGQMSLIMAMLSIKSPNYLLGFSVASTWAATILSRWFEKDADLFAKTHGQDLIPTFQKTQIDNIDFKKRCGEMRWFDSFETFCLKLKGKFICQNGDDLCDIGHPMLSTRIAYLQKLSKEYKK